jgi:hypothetical protein
VQRERKTPPTHPPISVSKEQSDMGTSWEPSNAATQGFSNTHGSLVDFQWDSTFMATLEDPQQLDLPSFDPVQMGWASLSNPYDFQPSDAHANVGLSSGFPNGLWDQQ